MNGPQPEFWLDEAAAADLAAIVDYTAQEWGEEQARIYLAHLRDCLTEMATGHPRVRAADDIHRGLKLMRCQHHFICGLAGDSGHLRVVAILHERMDQLVRLKGRLPA